jgi:hypothetical protein
MHALKMALIVSFTFMALGVGFAQAKDLPLTPEQREAAIAERDKRIEQMKLSREAFLRIDGMKTVVQHLSDISLDCGTANDCAVIPMGSRACGGPTSFVLTSKANPSLQAVLSTVALVTKAESDANVKFGMMSICSVETPPPVACLKNMCITQ